MNISRIVYIKYKQKSMLKSVILDCHRDLVIMGLCLTCVAFRMLWRTNWTLKNGHTSLSVLLPGTAPGLSGNSRLF